MSARIVILNVLDPSGEQGLTIDLQAAFDAGATSVLPLATGSLIDGAVVPADGKALGAILDAALADPVSAMLIGSMPNSRIAGAIAGALGRDLPETLVFAPGAYIEARTWFVGSANRQQREHFQTLTRECTVTVMTAKETAAWLDTGDLDAEQAGEQLCAAGAYSAWIRDERGSVRSLDRLVTDGNKAVLDYPTIAEDQPDRIPGALTALLASGLTLQEAVAAAQRHAACPVSAEAAACR
jgi:hydroxymethylpyrimidine/phosphomethylpyrimidine kinase